MRPLVVITFFFVVLAALGTPGSQANPVADDNKRFDEHPSEFDRELLKEITYRLKVLVISEKGEALQRYMENLKELKSIWFRLEKVLIKRIIELVPKPDEMVRKWDIEIIGSLFSTFAKEPAVYQYLKERLPMSFEMAATAYPGLRFRVAACPTAPAAAATKQTTTATTVAPTTDKKAKSTTDVPATKTTSKATTADSTSKTTAKVTKPTTTEATTTTTTTTSTPPSGDVDPNVTMEERIAKIKELVESKKGAELQKYVESIPNLKDMWFYMERKVILRMVELVPQPDEMVKKWDVNIIGSLFTTFVYQKDTFERLKTMLPQSFKIAAENFSMFRDDKKASTTTTSKATTTTTTTTTATTTTSAPTTVAPGARRCPNRGCGNVDPMMVQKHINTIVRLLHQGRFAELKSYMRNIKNLPEVWYRMHVNLVLDIIFMVPDADDMIKDLGAEVIGSLFVTFRSNYELFEYLKFMLPQSYRIAVANFPMFGAPDFAPSPNTPPAPTPDNVDQEVYYHLANIWQLLHFGHPEALQAYMENIRNIYEVWWGGDLDLFLRVISTVPHPDAMVQKWPHQVIGSLFTSVYMAPELFEHLKFVLPMSFAKARKHYTFDFDIKPPRSRKRVGNGFYGCPFGGCPWQPFNRCGCGWGCPRGCFRQFP